MPDFRFACSLGTTKGIVRACHHGGHTDKLLSLTLVLFPHAGVGPDASIDMWRLKL